jgi:hypothetical protein
VWDAERITGNTTPGARVCGIASQALDALTCRSRRTVRQATHGKTVPLVVGVTVNLAGRAGITCIAGGSLDALADRPGWAVWQPLDGDAVCLVGGVTKDLTRRAGVTRIASGSCDAGAGPRGLVMTSGHGENHDQAQTGDQR